MRERQPGVVWPTAEQLENSIRKLSLQCEVVHKHKAKDCPDSRLTRYLRYQKEEEANAKRK